MPAPDTIVAGAVYGHLTILRKEDGHARTTVRTLCSCGTESSKNWYNVKSGRTTSCGCVGKTTHVKHGNSGIRLYNIWSLMKVRCLKSYATGFKYYGGRGITFDPSWDSYEVFRAWALSHGYNDNLTLERVNVNGNYDPNNCIWAPQTTQSANTRKRSKTKHSYIGVDQLPSGNWRATIQVNKTIHRLGSFQTEREAVEARNQFIIDNGLPHIQQ